MLSMIEEIIFTLTPTFFLLADPPDINPDNESHQKSNAHKFRRGRFRYDNDRNLSSSTSQQYGHFDQGFKPPLSHGSSNYTVHQHPHYQEENGTRRRGRGRGRREGNRNVNETFSGSGSFWQTPGGDNGPYSGKNRDVGGQPMEGPDGPNWRRDVNRNLEQTNEDQDAQPKKPRKFNQEQRGRRQNERGSRLKEDNTTKEVQRSNHVKAESPLDTREKTQRSREGPDLQYDDNWRKHTEVKRRQGPIKPTKPLSRDGRSSEMEADEHGSGHVLHDSFRTIRGSGRHTNPQARGGRRTHPQNQRPRQRNWDKMPESKESQTGKLKVP